MADKQDFHNAVAYITKGPKLNTSNDVKLQFYALFKQVLPFAFG